MDSSNRQSSSTSFMDQWRRMGDEYERIKAENERLKAENAHLRGHGTCRQKINEAMAAMRDVLSALPSTTTGHDESNLPSSSTQVAATPLSVSTRKRRVPATPSGDEEERSVVGRLRRGTHTEAAPPTQATRPVGDARKAMEPAQLHYLLTLNVNGSAWCKDYFGVAPNTAQKYVVEKVEDDLLSPFERALRPECCFQLVVLFPQFLLLLEKTSQQRLWKSYARLLTCAAQLLSLATDDAGGVKKGFVKKVMQHSLNSAYAALDDREEAPVGQGSVPLEGWFTTWRLLCTQDVFSFLENFGVVLEVLARLDRQESGVLYMLREMLSGDISYQIQASQWHRLFEWMLALMGDVDKTKENRIMAAQCLSHLMDSSHYYTSRGSGREKVDVQSVWQQCDTSLRTSVSTIDKRLKGLLFVEWAKCATAAESKTRLNKKGIVDVASWLQTIHTMTADAIDKLMPQPTTVARPTTSTSEDVDGLEERSEGHSPEQWDEDVHFLLSALVEATQLTFSAFGSLAAKSLVESRSSYCHHTQLGAFLKLLAFDGRCRIPALIIFADLLRTKNGGAGALLTTRQEELLVNKIIDSLAMTPQNAKCPLLRLAASELSTLIAIPSDTSDTDGDEHQRRWKLINALAASLDSFRDGVEWKRSVEEISARDATLAALAKLLCLHNDSLSTDHEQRVKEIVHKIIEHLPVVRYREDIVPIYGFVASLIEQKSGLHVSGGDPSEASNSNDTIHRRAIDGILAAFAGQVFSTTVLEKALWMEDGREIIVEMVKLRQRLASILNAQCGDKELLAAIFNANGLTAAGKPPPLLDGSAGGSRSGEKRTSTGRQSTPAKRRRKHRY